MRRFFTYAAAAFLTGGLCVNACCLAADAPVAKATLEGAGDNKGKIHGTVTFTQEAGGVKMVADVEGLTPGQHGFHIHDKPDLSAPDFTSAGGHWNPDMHQHGGPADKEHHAGDMGNITADDKGHGHLELMMSGVSVDGKNPVVGHSVIVHEKADDYKTQNPPGNAGKRIAGGVIEAEKR
jgi:Cu-Zn family superoxide dismutase